MGTLRFAHPTDWFHGNVKPGNDTGRVNLIEKNSRATYPIIGPAEQCETFSKPPTSPAPRKFRSHHNPYEYSLPPHGSLANYGRAAIPLLDVIDEGHVSMFP